MLWIEHGNLDGLERRVRVEFKIEEALGKE